MNLSRSPSGLKDFQHNPADEIWHRWHEPRIADAEQLPSIAANNMDFIAMRHAYQASGGLPCGDDLALSLEQHARGDFVSLARLIVAGDVFGFEWHHTFWIPRFQFDRSDYSLKAGPRQVLAELSADFDGWTVAVWFAQPNARLAGRRPVDLLEADLPAVIQAARADCRMATR
jgi:hypothetical protein